MSHTELMETETTAARWLGRASRDSAVKTLEQLGYTDEGGELWKPPIGKAPDFNLIDSLRAEVEALRADAERYRWLREQEDSDEVFCMYGSNGRYGECGHKDIGGALLDKTIDTAITAARAAQEKQDD